MALLFNAIFTFDLPLKKVGTVSGKYGDFCFKKHSVNIGTHLEFDGVYDVRVVRKSSLTL